ncbi:MAG: class I adenylate-forming enzyme family protein [Actinomycetota bacterium]|nr:class I adenylate-forming enzyme family protein [Actinomycetota bacterium]
MTTWNDLFRTNFAESDDPAVVTSAFSWSGRQLARRAGGAAEWLDQLGFGPGEYVPMIIDETPEAIALAVGATLSRRVPAPLGTKLPAGDLAAAIDALGGKVIVADARTAELAQAAAALIGARVAVLGELPEADVPTEAKYGAVGIDEIALVIHTSGTTGLPKPIPASHRRLVARIRIYTGTMGIGPTDRYCSASPFAHTAGVAMAYTVLAIGASIIPQDWFSIDKWREAGRLGVTCALLVPTMIDILLGADALADANPRVLQYGASPIHPDTLAAALRALPDTRFVQVFGQTEVSPICVLTHEDHMRALHDRPDLLGTVGRPPAGVELRVEHPDSEGIGEIAVRSEHAFVTDADGWRRTGDFGRADDEGYYSLHGRVNDRIVRGGENIYPVEVEVALVSHPGVREAAVVGSPDRRYGEVVKAVVVCEAVFDPAVARPTVDELQLHVRNQLAHFKVPAIIEFADELPRNASGKVLRRKLI